MEAWQAKMRGMEERKRKEGEEEEKELIGEGLREKEHGPLLGLAWGSEEGREA